MNCIPLLVRKKRNLHSYNGGSGYSLCFELRCGAGKNLRSSASLLGTCSTSPTQLQWCFFYNALCATVLYIKCELTNRKYIRSKRSMQIYVTIWNGWNASQGVFNKKNLWRKTFNFLYIAIIIDNWRSVLSQNTLLARRISFVLYLRHSLNFEFEYVTTSLTCKSE